MLADTDDDNVFAIDTIRIIILFLWKNFFWMIVYKIFVPFMVYILFTIVYMTYIYEE